MDALGGDEAVQRMFDYSPQRVNNWRRFQTFPADTCDAMRTALKRRRYDAPPALWRQIPACKGWEKPPRRKTKVMG